MHSLSDKYCFTRSNEETRFQQTCELYSNLVTAFQNRKKLEFLKELIYRIFSNWKATPYEEHFLIVGHSQNVKLPHYPTQIMFNKQRTNK